MIVLFLLAVTFLSLSCDSIGAKAFGVMTKVEDFSPSLYFSTYSSEYDSTKILDVQGIEVDAYGLVSYYFVYHGDLDHMQDVVLAMQSTPFHDVPKDSVLVMKSCDNFEPASFEREVLGDADDFFWSWKSLETNCFSYTAPPWSHLIVCDRNSDLIYHRIDEVTN